MSDGEQKQLGRREVLKCMSLAAAATATVGSAVAATEALGHANGETSATGVAGSQSPHVAVDTAPVPSAVTRVEAPTAPAPDVSIAPVADVDEPARVDPGAAVRALFGPIGPGARVGGCTVVAVHRPVFGGIPVVLATAGGTEFQVDVLARDHGEAGVGNSPSLSIFVVNDGNGQTGTHEAQGLGAMALGRALADRESSGASVPELLTRGERARRYPAGAFRIG